MLDLNISFYKLSHVTGNREPKAGANRKPKGRRGPNRFPGIGQDAKQLGVCRQHLFAVATGQRRSPALLAEFLELQAARQQRQRREAT
jgi:hypothetical protein